MNFYSCHLIPFLCSAVCETFKKTRQSPSVFCFVYLPALQGGHGTGWEGVCSWKFFMHRKRYGLPGTPNQPICVYKSSVSGRSLALQVTDGGLKWLI
jgi:hypothetical protein